MSVAVSATGKARAQSRDASLAVLRYFFPLVVAAGLLDATAILNTGSFGIGVYIPASGLAGLLMLIIAVRHAPLETYLTPTEFFVVALAFLGIWTSASSQLWQSIGSPPIILTQSMLRTMLLGQMLVMLLLCRMIDDSAYVERVTLAFLSLFLLYGLYDFAAQVLGWPRFLNFLRNNESFFVSQQTGEQGWIRLPRLSSLAPEPSLTTFHVALSYFLASRMQRWRRSFYLVVTAFLIGTFARSLWVVVLAGAGGALGMALLRRAAPGLPRRTSILTLGLAACLLPAIATFAPLFTVPAVDADPSVVERIDSSASALRLFFEHPLTGVGYQGWSGSYFRFSDVLYGSIRALNQVHNGYSAQLAALGVIGAVIIYLPSLLVLSASNLSSVEKGWWLAGFSASALGGDFLSAPSTWTVLALVLVLAAPPVRRPSGQQRGASHAASVAQSSRSPA